MSDKLQRHSDESKIEKTLDDASEFFRIEKDLISYGYFSVSNNHKKDKNSLVRRQTKKIVVIRKTANEQVIATIRSYDDLGQPGNGDLRLFMGLMKMIQYKPEHRPYISNPIRFKASELLRLIGYQDTKTPEGKTKRAWGKSTYQMVYKWLDRMATTSVKLEGNLTDDEKTFYGIKGGWRFADNYFVQGETLADGTLSECIEVVLSERAIMNLNRFRTVPINFEAFFSLKKDIAQILVPLLQIWFYGGSGIYKKNYAEFCNLLGITEYKQESLIAQTLFPSLDELVEKRFLRDYKIEKNKARTGFNLILGAGSNFYQALKFSKQNKAAALQEGEIIFKVVQPALPKADLTVEEKELYERLKAIGLYPNTIRELFEMFEPFVLERRLDFAEYAAEEKRQRGEEISKLAGFIKTILLTNTVPAEFQSKKERLAAEEIAELLNSEAETAKFHCDKLEMAYYNYLREYWDKRFTALSPEERERRQTEYLQNTTATDRQRIANLSDERRKTELYRLAKFRFEMEFSKDEPAYDKFLLLDSEDNLISKYDDGNFNYSK